MNGIKHDRGKPAFHLIDERFDREVIDDLSETDHPGYLWDWAAGESPDNLHHAFAACVNWLNTDNPKRVARLELARALAFGAEKYSANNWREGFKWSRLWRAAYGHIESHRSGDLYDDESGLLHLSHAMVMLMFLVVHERDSLGEDDRAEIWPRENQKGGIQQWQWQHGATGQNFFCDESRVYPNIKGCGEKATLHNSYGRAFYIYEVPLKPPYGAGTVKSCSEGWTLPSALKDMDFVNQIRKDIWPDSQSTT